MVGRAPTRTPDEAAADRGRVTAVAEPTDLVTALREVLLPAAWQEHRGGWVTFMTTEHLERLRALVANLQEEP